MLLAIIIHSLNVLYDETQVFLHT